jgi:capsular exopolysaccharide synthesis family protein
VNQARNFLQPAAGFGLLQPVSGVNDANGGDGGDTLNLHSLLTTLRRRQYLFLAVFGLVLAATIFLTLRQQTLYTATAQIVLTMREEKIAPNTMSQPALTPADRADTEVEVLKSRVLAERVARSLRLAQDPSFNPALAPSGGTMNWLRSLVGLPEVKPAPLTPEETMREMVDRLQESLSVTRQGETFAIQLSVTTNSAKGAAAIANEYVRLYTQGQLQEKVAESAVATKFLGSRLEELRAQAQADTGRVQQYRIANNLLSTSGASLTEQEIASYNQGVAEARAQTSEDLARLNTARGQMRGGSNGDDVGEALQSPVVASLRAKQAEVSGQLAMLRGNFGPLHPDVVRVTGELADIDKQIQAEIRRVMSNLDARTRVSSERLNSIAGSLSSAKGKLAQNNAAMTGLDDLQRRAQASQSLYESYLNRYKEAVAQGGTERPDASVISKATVPLVPTSPRPKLNMLLGCVLGLGAGLLAAFLAEVMFAGITTGNEVEQKLGQRYLGGIPLLPALRSETTATGDTISSAPRSAFAEAFRNLLTSIQQACATLPRVIVISSALPREGKSTTAICLARTIARQGQRTLLIDGDFAKPMISHKLAAPGTDGLIEVLKGSARFEDAVVQDSTPGLDILPIRHSPGDAAEIIVGPGMTGLLERARQTYDCIVIDTAPVLPIASSRILAAMADAVVFVARWRHTPDHAVAAALRLLPPREVKLVGVVLSQIDMQKQVRFGHGDPSSYYNKYKSYYT